MILQNAGSNSSCSAALCDLEADNCPSALPSMLLFPSKSTTLDFNEIDQLDNIQSRTVSVHFRSIIMAWEKREIQHDGHSDTNSALLSRMK